MTDKALSSLTSGTPTASTTLYGVIGGNSRKFTVDDVRTSIGIPSSSTDNAVPRFDGTGGNLQTSNLTISDAGLVTSDVSLTQTDGTAWAQAIAGRFGAALSGTANQFAFEVQANIPVTGAGAAYEKCGILVISATSDPSTSFDLDCVGVDMRGYIAAANTLGRAWGGYSEARIVSGGSGDGLLFGHEVQVVNNGTTQASLDTTTSKYGIAIYSNGSNPATAALYISDAGSTFRKGVIVKSSALTNATDPAFGISDSTFTVARSGAVTASVAGTAGRFVNTTDSASVTVLKVEGDRATPAGNDTIFADYLLSDSAGTQIEGFRQSVRMTVVTAGSVTSQVFWGLRSSGTYADRMLLTPSELVPVTSDGLSLGTSSLMWSDLFLASGGVINWNNGDVTITHASNLLTVSGGVLAAPINLFTVASVNFNSANTDTALTISLPVGYTRYRISNVVISGASASITTATFGLFTATGGAGTAVIAAGTAITVSTASEGTNNNMQTTAAANTNTQSQTEATLYFRIGTPQGSAATATVSINYTPVS